MLSFHAFLVLTSSVLFTLFQVSFFCGPVIILKVDSGLYQMVASADSISQHEKLKEMGFLILMGLLNVTSIKQEMEVIYEAFMSAMCAARS